MERSAPAARGFREIKILVGAEIAFNVTSMPSSYFIEQGEEPGRRTPPFFA